jgi:glycosyltransferase involved in cell wall biosynthesis
VVDAAAVEHEVVVVVVPIAGRLPGDASRVANDHVRVVELAPTPMPTADSVAAMLAQSTPVVAVVAVRLGVALLAAGLADRLGAALVVDADDDDVAFHLQAGDNAAADHWREVGAAVLPRAGVVLVASPTDAQPMAARYDLAHVAVVPNAVELPARVLPTAPGTHRLLMMANFTYAPNVDGAVWFVTTVLPLLDDSWHLVLVGSAAPEVEALAGHRVTVTGWVPDVCSHYDDAAVVIAPLHQGSGTRIKILEAFAQCRPVVATSVAVTGIDAVADVHLLVADDAADFAAAVMAAADPVDSTALVDAAAKQVHEHYRRSKVVDELVLLLRRVANSPAPPVTSPASVVVGKDEPMVPPPPPDADRSDSSAGPRTVVGLDVNEVDDGLVIYDGERDRVHYLNPTAGVVFALCDGTVGEHELGAHARRALGADEPTDADVAECLASLRREGLVT